MPYQRVIPRDFFNESKLLKCMGQLTLKVLDGLLPDGIEITIDETGKPFEIVLNNDYNMLMVINYDITVNGEIIEFGTTYNSKSPFPFFCIVDYTEYEVFTNAGEFTQEFIDLFTNK